MHITELSFKYAIEYAEMGEPDKAKEYLNEYKTQLQSLNVGDTFSFGKYIMSGSVKPERHRLQAPIVWEVLTKEPSRLLVIAKHCLDWLFFDGNVSFGGTDGTYKTSWADSTIRSYLNEELMEQCFTKAEKQVILTSKVVPEDNPVYGTKGGESTYNKLFLLTPSEADRFFPDHNGFSNLVLVDFSFPEDGTITIDEEPKEWWLNCLGEDPEHVAVMGQSGAVDYSGISCDADEIGVRPAMWIGLELFNEEIIEGVLVTGKRYPFFDESKYPAKS